MCVLLPLPFPPPPPPLSPGRRRRCADVVVQRRIEDALCDYDMDDADADWLQQYNAKVRRRLTRGCACAEE